MKNVTATMSKDGKLTLVIDTTKRFGPSASGKTIIVASSEGNQTVPGLDNMKFGLNVYESAPKG